MRINRWIWWTTVILLYLRTELLQAADFFRSSAENEKTKDNIDNWNSTKIEPKPPKTAKELGVHVCESNQDCVNGGVCHRGKDGHGICLCPRSCPTFVPPRCGNRRSTAPCLVMDKDYRSKYDLRDPTCYMNGCVCPPQFDTVYVTADQKPLRLNSTLLPTKCDKRDLAVVGRVHPSLSVFKGIDVTMFCCVNLDPEGFIDVANVFFIQNGTLMREPTSHPFSPSTRGGIARRVHEKQSCWELEIKNVQTSDSGTYMCRVTASAPDLDVTDTMQFEVKAPRQISKLNVTASERDAIVTWESEGEEMAIDLRKSSHHRSRRYLKVDSNDPKANM